MCPKAAKAVGGLEPQIGQEGVSLSTGHTVLGLAFDGSYGAKCFGGLG